MPQIYQEYSFKPGDGLDEKINKLYLGIMSVEEDLYCKGSALSVLQKEIDSLKQQLREIKWQKKNNTLDTRSSKR